MSTTEFDVCVVGSGAGGGTLAWALAEAGVNVVVLEKGPYYTLKDFAYHDEIKIQKRSFFTPLEADEPRMLRQAGEAEYKRTRTAWLANCVGGGTVHMSGYFLRLHEIDFEMRTRFGREARSTVEDWPIRYAEFAPWYDRMEYLLGVGGTAGQNPFDPPRSVPYPLPPIAEHPFTAPFDKAAKKLGLHPFSTPRAILSQPYGGRPPCMYCGYCGNFGCEIGAKSSVLSTFIPRAEATGKCTIKAKSMVTEVFVNADGKAGGVRYLDEQGNLHEQRAKVVVVSATALESARLLLNSKSSLFPDGLANSSGQVGKNLIFSTFASIEADFSRTGKAKDFPGYDSHLPFLGRSLQDYYLPKKNTGVPKGGTLLFDLGPKAPITRLTEVAIKAAGATETKPLWGKPLKDNLRKYLRDVRKLECEVFGEFSASDGCYLDVDPEVKDKFGLPVARLNVGLLESNVKGARFLAERAADLFREMKAEEVRFGIMGGASWVLQHGTCRFGKDPSTSVLDPNCRAHDVKNLYVVDGSFMPTSGGVPTTLTIMSNALRVAHHIRDAFAKKEH